MSPWWRLSGALRRMRRFLVVDGSGKACLESGNFVSCGRDMFGDDERVRVSLRTLAAWGVFGLTCVLVAAGGWLNGGGAGRGQVQPADAVTALAFTATGALSSPANCQ